MTVKITIQDVLDAKERIRGTVLETPCQRSSQLAEYTGFDTWCKLEFLQRTGSFKERGASNALALLSDEQKRRGVIAASAGNHALALAYHGQRLGVDVKVVMPTFAPMIKISTCRSFDAEVILHGTSFGEAVQQAHEIGEAEGRQYVHGFDDPPIIAGQGTMGLEILEQVPDVDAVVIPIGGAGLIAGTALAIKSQRPEVKVIGVEPINACCYMDALNAGKPVKIAAKPTLADGLAVHTVGDNAFELARDLIDKVVTVTESEIALAILRLVEREKSVVEGSGAASLAACIAGKLPELEGKKVVLALCGGNIDPSILSRIIEVGLAADGRIIRFTARISDRPGGLAEFAKVIAKAGASIKDITHDRTFAGPDVSAVHVQCKIETSSHEHIERVYQSLREHKIPFRPVEIEAETLSAYH
ncbi:L-threonine dehydratase catabolic TdcB [Poriferisphaera corsica]|uniref:L-threonine dehydratase catabolic TdcB n=1 Tax=Poriferisphaera corsica TaxID=2528020 RepID=A0A517YW43_9BACT|nr:threonine ammonia-lyase [Poriferisphaera corsica]QDU34445.1 L-threonine dehydratase catabolic TdcB [Poriferisphaera corsica]